MQNHRSWLADQAYHLGRIVTKVVLDCGQQTISGVKGLPRLAGVCAGEFLAGVRAQRAERIEPSEPSGSES